MKRPILHRNEKEIIRILFMQDRPLSVNEINKRSGMSWLTAKKYLGSCIVRGIVTNHSKNTYRLHKDLIRKLRERKYAKK